MLFLVAEISLRVPVAAIFYCLILVLCFFWWRGFHSVSRSPPYFIVYLVFCFMLFLVERISLRVPVAAIFYCLFGFLFYTFIGGGDFTPCPGRRHILLFNFSFILFLVEGISLRVPVAAIFYCLF